VTATCADRHDGSDQDAFLYIVGQLVDRFEEREEIREYTHMLEFLSPKAHTSTRNFLGRLSDLDAVVPAKQVEKAARSLARLIVGILFSSLIRRWTQLYGPESGALIKSR
jgi:hypothetical protein